MNWMLITEFFNSACYIFIILGVWMIFSTSIISLLRKNRFTRFRIGKKQIGGGKLLRHLSLLITLTSQGKSFSVSGFMILSMSIFFAIFILLINQISVVSALLFSVFFGLVPYLFLLIRLNILRTEGSFEADLIVGELLNQYKINYFNMIEAIDRMVMFREAPICRKAFYRLSLLLKEYKTEEELTEALKEMVFLVNTDWMRMLTNNIYLAVECRTNVSIGLEDILLELREAKTATEKAKQINLEGFSILKYFSPAMYLLTVFIAVRYFGFSFKKFLSYQFYTEIGIKLFLLILLLMLINTSCMLLFQKQKFDL